VDRALYRWLRGRTLGAGPQTLLLATHGRGSGKPRTVPPLYVRDGERLAVAASNWGRKEHPRWSENLLADPRALVKVGDAPSEERRARLAREKLWPRFLELCLLPTPLVGGVGRRQIRVFVLEAPAAKRLPC
jgi:deazaflavin-dependent oxidoreductase (nitroreductase family)